MKVSVTPGAITRPSSSWQAADRQCHRKAGLGNIFRGVELRQLQRLFHASGDRDAERRARLVWGHCSRLELAGALWGLRVRGCKRTLKEESPCALGSRWLRAFDHLRIDEGSVCRSDKEEDEETDTVAVVPMMEAHQRLKEPLGQSCWRLHFGTKLDPPVRAAAETLLPSPWITSSINLPEDQMKDIETEGVDEG